MRQLPAYILNHHGGLGQARAPQVALGPGAKGLLGVVVTSVGRLFAGELVFGTSGNNWILHSYSRLSRLLEVPRILNMRDAETTGYASLVRESKIPRGDPKTFNKL